MTPYYQDEAAAIYLGDCLEVLRGFADNSVDAVVTDPPYGLSFMGKLWDYAVPRVEVWYEVLRVLKPGGHLLSFFGSRTYHRGVCEVEDAGFYIRDEIMWLYGSGFPKSLDVGKAIENHFNTKGTKAALHEEHEGGSWEGWGTALKPAHEPIVVARKPLAGTVAGNVLAWGTGGINVDGCRVGWAGTKDAAAAAAAAVGFREAQKKGCASVSYGMQNTQGVPDYQVPNVGRWPANVIHDGSEEAVAGFPESSVTGSRSDSSRESDVEGTGWLPSNHKSVEYQDSGSAARFFYCAKASKADRDEGLEDLAVWSGAQRTGRKEGSAGINAFAGAQGSARNHHPTVKPEALMRYLCRLITPPGGVVLDPFCGSGSTGKAAMLEGFRFIGIEQAPEFLPIARGRIRAGLERYQQETAQGVLF
jgi:DNA modification methylase